MADKEKIWSSDLNELSDKIDGLEEVGTILTQQGGNTLTTYQTIASRSVSITAGTWIVTGNVYNDSTIAVSGYLKGALSLEYNSFDEYNTTTIDMGTDEMKCGFSVLPMYITVTEDTNVFLNMAREDKTYLTVINSIVQAIRIA